MEERRSDGIIVFGINSYRELCGLHFGGITLASLELIIKCSNQAAKRAKNIVQHIREALEVDEKSREKGDSAGFRHYLQSNTFDSHNEDRLFVRLERFRLNGTEEMEVELAQMKEEQARIKSLGENAAVLMQPAEEMSENDDDDSGDVNPGNLWIPETDNDIEDEPLSTPADHNSPKEEKSQGERKKNKKNDSIVDLVSDSEEEDTVVLQQIT